MGGAAAKPIDAELVTAAAAFVAKVLGLCVRAWHRGVGGAGVGGVGGAGVGGVGGGVGGAGVGAGVGSYSQLQSEARSSVQQQDSRIICHCAKTIGHFGSFRRSAPGSTQY